MHALLKTIRQRLKSRTYVANLISAGVAAFEIKMHTLGLSAETLLAAVIAVNVINMALREITTTAVSQK